MSGTETNSPARDDGTEMPASGYGSQFITDSDRVGYWNPAEAAANCPFPSPCRTAVAICSRSAAMSGEFIRLVAAQVRSIEQVENGAILLSRAVRRNCIQTLDPGAIGKGGQWTL